MSEPNDQKRGLLEILTGKNLKHLLRSVIATALAGWAIGVAFDSHKRAEFMAMRYDAYLTISQFAPWNIAQRYVGIVFTQGNSYAEDLAKKQEQQTALFRGFACDLRELAPSVVRIRRTRTIHASHWSILKAFVLSTCPRMFHFRFDSSPHCLICFSMLWLTRA